MPPVLPVTSLTPVFSPHFHIKAMLGFSVVVPFYLFFTSLSRLSSSPLMSGNLQTFPFPKLSRCQQRWLQLAAFQVLVLAIWALLAGKTIF